MDMKFQGILYKDNDNQKTTSTMLAGVLNPTTAPALALVANTASTLTAATYYVTYTWENKYGETEASSEASISVTSGNDLKIDIPALPASASNAVIYVGTLSGGAKKQAEITTTTYTLSANPIDGVLAPKDNTTFKWSTQVTLINASGTEILTASNPGSVAVTSLPSLPAGTNNIGNVVTQHSFNPVTLVASAARTTGASTASTDVAKFDKAVVFLDVTAASGTSPTLDVKVEGLDPASNKWIQIASFTQATAVGSQRITIPDLFESAVRVTYTLGGTSPSFTFSVGAVFKS